MDHLCIVISSKDDGSPYNVFFIIAETSDASPPTGRGIADPEYAESESRSATAGGSHVRRKRSPVQGSGHPPRNRQSTCTNRFRVRL